MSPDFDRKKGKPKRDNLPATIPGVVPEKFEPRCNVCKSEFRKAIDRLIAIGTPNAEISRLFSTEEHNVDRRSVAKHAADHLSYEDGAIRRIIEREAEEAKVDLENGVTTALNRRVFLQAFVQKSLEQLANGSMEVEAKDTLNAIQLLDRMDSNTEGVQVDEIRVQFNAFVQAIQETVTPDVWYIINNRTKELLHRDGQSQLETGE